ncbi:hypothetical protein IU414_18265 [Nocardia farcinica]|uniref:hypothetical protein n=1 Tax=Nocardia farcinica TaxID=37329 RepID=UPI001894B318|nr:hypothetical protein [Nocardia farcinica]MBF6253927.1 hypothetical protein [Nocardia farcinica]MBF6265465.1 hypothetical protein [Nocardia farcinica]MBF6284065.1 hypothetical protein [Nocardia farcinica]MBF6308097.1 hypothetical protein [Nocardia farcinica]MBF6511656.1 hypothetical protein [Nocardia farcinica]
MIDPECERAAIRAAMKRLLDGTPQRSTGALSILQLAAEAGVKRWVLTHKHTDLADEFRCRVRETNALPSTFSPLQQRLQRAEDDNRALRTENARLHAQVDAYAQVIHELRRAMSRTEPTPRLSAVVDQSGGNHRFDAQWT